MDVAHLPPGYTEWPAPAALRDSVACLWAQVTGGADRAGLVLPDGRTDLIWTQGRGASVAGPDTGPVPTTMAAGTVILGARFRPSAGGPALGIPLSELRDQRVDLADLRPADARRLSAALDPQTAAARVLDVTGALPTRRAGPRRDRAARLLRDPQARAEDVAAEVGLSMRQLRRRCHAAVGYGPKTLQRVLRFRRFVSRIDACPDVRPRGHRRRGGLRRPGPPDQGMREALRLDPGRPGQAASDIGGRVADRPGRSG